MPLPVSTVLLVGALVGAQLNSAAAAIICAGIALVNELGRMGAAAAASAQPQGNTYELPARERTPFNYGDDGGA